jgi:tripartite-type tricarboxylate transporter receptor subunit TctC
MALHSTPTRRRLLLGGMGILTSGLGGTPPALAQAGPAASGTSLRILTTAPGGTIPDIVARRYAEQLAPAHPAGIVVDNRAGAAGRIAVAALKQAAPDGRTMLLAQGAVAAVYPFLYPNLSYDPAADLRPVSVAAESLLGLAVGPLVPAAVTDLRGLLEWASANPAQASYGSPGVGTLPHLMVALFAGDAGQVWTHVPYPGGPPALVDLMAGRLAALALPEGLLRPQLAAGRLRVLAVSGTRRSVFLPDVPSVVEQGLPRLAMREWFGFFLPGGATPAAAEAASRTIREAARQPSLQAALADAGMTASAGTPDEMRQRIADELPYWQRVLASTGIRAE